MEASAPATRLSRRIPAGRAGLPRFSAGFAGPHLTHAHGVRARTQGPQLSVPFHLADSRQRRAGRAPPEDVGRACPAPANPERPCK